MGQKSSYFMGAKVKTHCIRGMRGVLGTLAPIAHMVYPLLCTGPLILLLLSACKYIYIYIIIMMLNNYTTHDKQAYNCKLQIY